MNFDLKVGQVLWLKVRYQIDKVSDIKHPMLIADIKENYIEVIAIDKTKGKLQNLYYPYNKYINCNNPKETVLFEDSYAQFNELLRFRKTTDILSNNKLEDLLQEYKDYQNNNKIKEERIVYMTKDVLLELNK